eukprot:TRINITY_DN547_c0_g1_i9.p1 TRINITY_DN547_c0_g1~~TRINITY_DN547_c0_g1_i9.p1  ORF type:complete len:119 (+),score=4.04 TRINITY_DN547_c0_g1_i9:365-721(+)
MVPSRGVVLICSSCALGLPYRHLSQHHHQQPLHQTPRCSGSSIPTTPVPTSSPATSAPDTDLSPMEAPSEGVEFPSQCTDANENHCWRIECDRFVHLTWVTFDSDDALPGSCGGAVHQ